MKHAYSERLYYLLQQVKEGKASPEEYDELLKLAEEQQSTDFPDEIKQYFSGVDVPPLNNADSTWNEMLEGILASDRVQETPVMHMKRRRLLRSAASWAAACVLVAGAIWWFAGPATKQQTAMEERAAVTDKAPGKEGAILTMADGRKILLDSMADGRIAGGGNANIILKDGQLIYQAAGSKNNDSLFLNTMSTPRGRQFRLQLPDGSEVWLNASSSIRYPVAFGKKERRVEVEGEVFFDIKKDAVSPFIVSLRNGTSIEVLGTSFNVNAYADEVCIRTTLIDGSIKLNTTASQQLLRPGQQAVVQQHTLQVQEADTDKVMAWKNGLFDFRDAPLEEVMRQLSRWYDIDVKYENGIPDLQFEGRLGRDVSLSRVLQFFRESGMHVRLEQNTLFITKK